jgi:hypothetical protein
VIKEKKHKSPIFLFNLIVSERLHTSTHKYSLYCAFPWWVLLQQLLIAIAVAVQLGVLDGGAVHVRVAVHDVAEDLVPRVPAGR